MDEIPEDVRKKAEMAYAPFMYRTGSNDAVIHFIALAILDERDRCAKISEHESEFAKSKFDELARRSESGENGLAYAMSAAMGLYAQADGIAGSIRGLSNDH